MAIYSGSTPKFLIKIKDNQGIQLDPSNIAEITEVQIIIFNAITGVTVGRFYLRVLPTLPAGETWSQLTTKNLGSDDVRVLLVLTAAQTQLADGNGNKIQIKTTVPDTEVTGGRITIKTGIFSEIIKSKS